MTLLSNVHIPFFVHLGIPMRLIRLLFRLHFDFERRSNASHAKCYGTLCMDSFDTDTSLFKDLYYLTQAAWDAMRTYNLSCQGAAISFKDFFCTVLCKKKASSAATLIFWENKK